jgi:hypothetical protein
MYNYEDDKYSQHTNNILLSIISYYWSALLYILSANGACKINEKRIINI